MCNHRKNISLKKVQAFSSYVESNPSGSGVADLQWRLLELSESKNVWNEADVFLYNLERVERVQVRLGHQVKILHLNLTGKSRRTVDLIGFNDMLKKTIEVDFKL